MKIRNGFVSNSSSSSFIIAVGKVKNIEEFQKATKDNYNFEFKQVKDIAKEKVIVQSFSYSEVCLDISELDPEQWIFEYYRCEGDDDDFTIYDDNGDFCDYDYDVDLSDFSEKAHAEMELITQFGSDSELSYGAGRNG